MAYIVVPTVATGDVWTAANHNVYVRDNFRATIPGVFDGSAVFPRGIGLAMGGGAILLEIVPSTAPLDDYFVVVQDVGDSITAAPIGRSYQTNYQYYGMDTYFIFGYDGSDWYWRENYWPLEYATEVLQASNGGVDYFVGGSEVQIIIASALVGDSAGNRWAGFNTTSETALVVGDTSYDTGVFTALDRQSVYNSSADSLYMFYSGIDLLRQAGNMGIHLWRARDDADTTGNGVLGGFRAHERLFNSTFTT